MQELIDMAKELRELAAGLIDLQSVDHLEQIIDLLKKNEKEDNRKEIKDIIFIAWEAMNYEYHSLDQGPSALDDLPGEVKKKLYKMSYLIEQSQLFIIRVFVIRNLPLPDFLGGGALMVTFIDRTLPKGKRAYPALLKDLMKNYEIE